jgi:hypothetical protein
MAATKVTFTLDDVSLARLNDAASRLSMPKSEVVREAIMEFHERIGRLSERERTTLLRTFDSLVPKIPERAVAEVDQEIEDLRLSRRDAGRGTLAS